MRSSFFASCLLFGSALAAPMEAAALAGRVVDNLSSISRQLSDIGSRAEALSSKNSNAVALAQQFTRDLSGVFYNVDAAASAIEAGPAITVNDANQLAPILPSLAANAVGAILSVEVKKAAFNAPAMAQIMDNAYSSMVHLRNALMIKLPGGFSYTISGFSGIPLSTIANVRDEFKTSAGGAAIPAGLLPSPYATVPTYQQIPAQQNAAGANRPRPRPQNAPSSGRPASQYAAAPQYAAQPQYASPSQYGPSPPYAQYPAQALQVDPQYTPVQPYETDSTVAAAKPTPTSTYNPLNPFTWFSGSSATPTPTAAVEKEEPDVPEPTPTSSYSALNPFTWFSGSSTKATPTDQ